MGNRLLARIGYWIRMPTQLSKYDECVTLKYNIRAARSLKTP